jgi:hypothetical protein
MTTTASRQVTFLLNGKSVRVDRPSTDVTLLDIRQPSRLTPPY